MNQYSIYSLLVFITLILSYVLLQVFKVHLVAAYDLSIRLYLFVISIVAIVISLKIFNDGKYRITLFLSSLFIFLFLFRFVGLHRVSVHLFYSQKNQVFEESITILNSEKYSDFRYLSNSKGQLAERNKVIKDNENLGMLIEELGISEIFVSNYSKSEMVLFSVYRFIDNGHGYLYSNRELGDRVSVDGLQITGYIKLDKNWYAVSYT